MDPYEYIQNINLIEYFDEIVEQDSIFAYDYNEVQDLFYAPENYCVFLVGNSGLKKLDLMGLLIKSLLNSGKISKNILLLDFNLPILFEIDINQVVHDFICKNKMHKGHQHVQDLFIFINEIHFIPDWLSFIEKIHDDYPNVKLTCTSSACAIVNEKLHNEKPKYIKDIILSEKNNSNIKSQSNGSGIFSYFKYNIKNDYVEIKGLTGEGKKLNIINVPKEIEGKRVKIIASGAFHDRSELRKIILPDSIMMIGDYAFCNNIALEEINFPENLEYIGENAFLGANKLENISGGKGIRHIGNSAFYGTKWINEIKNALITLGNVLYKYQGTESRVIIPKNFVAISNWAFYDNKIIEEIVIENEHIHVEEGAFYGCSNLKKITGIQRHIGAFIFAYCSSLEQIQLDNVEYIGDYAFFHCQNLSKIDINHAELGNCVFSYCNRLQTVTGSPIKIGHGTFFGCSSLKYINLELTKSIGDFSLCNTNLEAIYLKADYIGDYALANNEKCQKIHINKESNIGKSILSNTKSLEELIIGGKHMISYYFDDISQLKLWKIDIHDEGIIDNILRQFLPLTTLSLSGVRNFGRWICYDCKNLQKVSISDDIHEIGDWAFTNCENLQYLELPESIERIGLNAFRYCRHLEIIKLNSKEVVQLSANSFYGTPSIMKILVPNAILNQYRKDSLWKGFKTNLEGF